MEHRCYKCSRAAGEYSDILGCVTEFCKDNTRSKSGLYYLCKTCDNNYKWADRQEDRKYPIAPPPGRKRCPKCNTVKSFECFTCAKNRKDGRAPYCKLCAKEYYQQNRETKLVKRKEHYQQNRESILAESKEYYQQNRELMCLKAREYHKLNPEKVRNRKRIYEKNKRATDDAYRLTKLARGRVRQAMATNGSSKSKRTDEYLGCSYNDFYKHISSMLYPGSELKDYEVDHMIPLKAQSRNEEELVSLFHYTNCRPLLKELNKLKSDDSEWWHYYTDQEYFFMLKETFSRQKTNSKGQKIKNRPKVRVTKNG